MTASRIMKGLVRIASDPRLGILAAIVLAVFGSRTSTEPSRLGLALFVLLATFVAFSSAGVHTVLLTALAVFAVGTLLSLVTSSDAPITGTSLSACALLLGALAYSTHFSRAFKALARWIFSGVDHVSFDRARSAALVVTIMMGVASIALISSNPTESFALAIAHAQLDAAPWLGATGVLYAIAVDTLLGATSVYLLSRRLGMSTVAAALSSTLWAMLGNRFAAQTFRFEPTSLVPIELLLLYVCDSRWARVLVVIGFGVASVMTAPQFAVPLGLVVLAFTLIAPLPPYEAWILRSAATLTATGVIIAVHFTSVAPVFSEGTAFCRALDASLQLLGNDGALPTNLLSPSASSGPLFSLLRSWDLATGRFGDVAALSVAPGLAPLMLAVVAYAAHRRTTDDARFLNRVLVALGIVLFFMLPSHLGGTPVPSIQLSLGALVPTAMRATLCALVAGMLIVLVAGFCWDRIPQMGRRLRVAILLCFIVVQVLETWPNTDLLRGGADSGLASALRWVDLARNTTHARLIVLGSRDEPFGIRDTLIASRYGPAMSLAYIDRSMIRQSSDAINVAALRAAHVSTIVVDWEGVTRFVPPEWEPRTALSPSLLAQTDSSFVPSLNVPGLQIKRIFGPVVVYSLPPDDMHAANRTRDVRDASPSAEWPNIALEHATYSPHEWACAIVSAGRHGCRQTIW